MCSAKTAKRTIVPITKRRWILWFIMMFKSFAYQIKESVKFCYSATIEMEAFTPSSALLIFSRNFAIFLCFQIWWQHMQTCETYSKCPSNCQAFFRSAELTTCAPSWKNFRKISTISARNIQQEWTAAFHLVFSKPFLGEPSKLIGKSPKILAIVSKGFEVVKMFSMLTTGTNLCLSDSWWTTEK